MSEDKMQSEAGFDVETAMSLAQLAGLDTTDISIIKSRLPEAGNYTWQLQGTELTMLAPKTPGQSGLPQVKYQLGIVEFEPALVDPNRDYSTMIGKTMRDSVTLWTSDLAESLGLLRGRYAKVGLNSAGPLGGVKDLPPGWLDDANGAFIKGRVRVYEDKNGEMRASVDWTAPGEVQEAEEA